MEENKRSKAERLAEEVLVWARNSLLVRLRFLDMALSRLTFAPLREGCVMTDGQQIFYNPRTVLENFKQNKETVIRDYLHMVMHCVFRHMFINPAIDRPLWDLAVDIAVENAISEIGLPFVMKPRVMHQEAFIGKLKKNGVALTAEQIYHFFKLHALDPKEAAQVRAFFYGDNHAIWYMTEEEKNEHFGLGTGNAQASDNTITRNAIIADWQMIAERMQIDIEVFQKKMQGLLAGGFVQNLKEVNRERYDYTAFLKKFAVLGEAMKINEDEFDYVYYTYGLSLYKNMPLVEPLEYKDVRRVKEFVIVIDTSGSTSGDVVQNFVQKTYNILKSTESFFSKINLHIIQCDAMVQEDKKITSQEEFDEYLKTMVIHGLGGTDFRPAFTYVNELIENKEFTNLKGLIYFTDGYGTFPERKPPYDTAFVFLEEENNNYEVPSWAMKLILRSEEI